MNNISNGSVNHQLDFKPFVVEDLDLDFAFTYNHESKTYMDYNYNLDFNYNYTLSLRDIVMLNNIQNITTQELKNDGEQYLLLLSHTIGNDFSTLKVIGQEPITINHSNITFSDIIFSDKPNPTETDYLPSIILVSIVMIISVIVFRKKGRFDIFYVIKIKSTGELAFYYIGHYIKIFVLYFHK